ncbi:hypothetical protein TNCV_3078331 [Trichonephila clavipes]|nr:hypothetical protein TNCV_3078331 [Trichonephila clavipes]
MHVKYVEAQTSSRFCGREIRREGVLEWHQAKASADHDFVTTTTKLSLESFCLGVNVSLLVQYRVIPGVSKVTHIHMVADRKRSGKASIVKTKVADVETALQRSPLKSPSVYLNIITEFIALLKVMKGILLVAARRRIVSRIAGTVRKF